MCTVKWRMANKNDQILRKLFVFFDGHGQSQNIKTQYHNKRGVFPPICGWFRLGLDDTHALHSLAHTNRRIWFTKKWKCKQKVFPPNGGYFDVTALLFKQSANFHNWSVWPGLRCLKQDEKGWRKNASCCVFLWEEKEHMLSIGIIRSVYMCYISVSAPNAC